MSLVRTIRRRLLLAAWRTLTKLGFEVRRASDYAERDLLQVCATHSTRLILDVGCNEGVVTARYRQLFPHAKIHGFEPLPDVAENARKRHAADPHVAIHACAVSSSSGSVTFHRNKAADSSSLLATAPETLPPNYQETNQTVEKLTVTCVRLDDFCADHGIQEIDLLKLDIQGGELEALRGAQTLLSCKRIRAIYCEVYFLPFYKDQPLFEEICLYLAKFDYRFVYPYGLVFGSKSGRLQWGDALFVSPDVKVDKKDWLLSRAD